MGRQRVLLILSVALFIAWGLFYLHSANSVIDRSKKLDCLISEVLSGFDISDEDLIRETREERHRGWRRHVHTSREYRLSKDIPLRDFGNLLEEALKGTPYNVRMSDYVLEKAKEHASYEVRFKRLDVLSLKITKAGVKRLPFVRKKFASPKVAVVLDDFGYNMRELETLFEMDIPVTFSILPNLRYSSTIAKEAHSRGYEVILHLPLESHREEVREEVDTINTDMSKEEVLRGLHKAAASVPNLCGVSNHMGSKATENALLMSVIFDYLKEQDLFFLDSLVTNKSVCEELARSTGIAFAKRSIFLDNEMDEEYIKAQLLKLREMAFKTGSAIAVGHGRVTTIRVLSQMLPEMKRDGIKFVRVSELTR